MTRRVVHVISTPRGIGGAERVVAALVEAGRSRGWEQLVLNPFGEADSELAVALQAPVRSRSVARKRNALGLRLWLSREISSFQPDLVHAHLFHASVAIASLRREGIPRVLSHHHGAVLSMKGRKSEEILDRWAGKRFDVVVAVSGTVRDYLLHEYGYPAKLVRTIWNGWEGSPRKRTVREPLHQPTVVCVANFRKEKGHTVLLRAFAKIEDRDPRLVLVGEGPLEKELKQQARELGIDERVAFVGAVSDVWPYLADADLFVLPSLYEPLGIVVMEAMASGLPVIASRVGGIPELVEGDVTGALVQPGDAEALAKELGRLLSDPDERARLAAAGRSRVRSLTMKTTTEKYLELYGELWSSETTR